MAEATVKKVNRIVRYAYPIQTADEGTNVTCLNKITTEESEVFQFSIFSFLQPFVHKKTQQENGKKRPTKERTLRA